MAVLAVVVVLIFSVVGLRLSAPGLFSPFAVFVVDVSGYLQRGFSAPVLWVREAWRSYVVLQDVRVENDVLRLELDRLQQEITRYREAMIANARLKRLLDIREESNVPMVTALVVAMDIAPWVATVTVDRGRADGVAPGMVVQAGAGVVGQVLEAAFHFSKVLLISDQNSAVAAMIQRNRVRGILRGVGEAGCRLTYVSKDADVSVGDNVITSGTDQIFPKGLLLGRVASVEKGSMADLFQVVSVTPAVDLNTIEEMLILLKKQEVVETVR